MPWHAELALEVVLAVLLCVRPDSRRWFQSLICVNLAFELAYIWFDRSGSHAMQVQLWWALILFEIPLWALSLREAEGRHRDLPVWWFALTMGCAWIRYYPYTGYCVIVINQAFFLAWIIDKAYSLRHEKASLRLPAFARLRRDSDSR